MSIRCKFRFFKPINERHSGVLPNSILFIGAASNYPKGFNILLNIMEKMDKQNFCLIMKDNYSIDTLPFKHRVRVFNRVNQETVHLIINSCICAVCPSYEETQHLAGIECGACNIPSVARKVGFYYDCQNDRDWGLIADDNTFIEKLYYVLNNISEFHPREYLIKKYSLGICKQNWIDIINDISLIK